MADIFISFKTEDTKRVLPVHNAFVNRGLSVFWSNDIPKGAPDYHAIIKNEIRKAGVVVVLWTHNSVDSHPVAQECSQAERDNKLLQVLLDDIAPIDFPMEVRFKAQKTMLLGWTGDTRHSEWNKLNEAIDARLKGQVGEASVRSKAGSDRTASSIDRFRDHPDAPEMVVVPPGEFSRGEPDSQHVVTFRNGFAAGRYSVTFEEWDLAVKGGAPLKKLPNRRSPRGAHPAVDLNWNEAKAYAAWLKRTTGKPYRLLSEAEWEYACRAGTGKTHYTIETLKQAQAEFSEGGVGSAKMVVEVGKMLPNAFGLHGMYGNVWEWCEDIWNDTYYGAPRDGSARTVNGYADFRAVRGGNFDDYPHEVQAMLRKGYEVRFRFVLLGFRVARALD